jgi:NADH-quinone oxidoreductase subunit C
VAPPDPAPPEGAVVPGSLDGLQAALPGAVTQLSFFVGDWTAIVPVARLLEAAAWLRAGGFDACADITASDWPERRERFDIIYVLYSVPRRERLRLKVRAADGEPVPSVAGIWPAASWLEREVYDLFGVPFSGHPDLRRILMPEAWQGHPQRKDYPLEGPGELLLENPLDWLRLKQAADEAEIE